MSRLQDLIAQLCPNGVPYKTLGEIGEFYSGLTGKSKKDFANGNAKYVTYMNVFKNAETSLDIHDFVSVSATEKQNAIQYGDILFTGSSETPIEAGLTSVVTQVPTEAIYLNSFCFGLRLNGTVDLCPGFAKYVFRSDKVRAQIIRAANGVTRFNLSKVTLKRVRIPVPPMAVQEEIARILDCFTALEAELEAELEARKKQYAYWRERLLSFGQSALAPIDPTVSVTWMTLGDVATYVTERMNCSSLTERSYVGVDNLLPNQGGKRDSQYVPSVGNVTHFQTGDILIGNIRPYLKKIWQADCEGGAGGDVLVIRSKDKCLLPRFLFQVLASDTFFFYDNQYARGAKMPRGDKTRIMQFRIPVPSLEEQERIVGILDKFEALCGDLSRGLPGELALRRKQFAYYRERLLTFKELAS